MMKESEKIKQRIDALKQILNNLIEDEEPYRKIYFVSLLIDKLSNKLYFPANNKN